MKRDHVALMTSLKIFPLVVRLAAFAVSTLVVFPYLYHLARGTDGYLTILTDDFYYYAMVADNLLRTGQATFDGVHATNGFHPLFFVVVLVSDALAGGLGRAFFLLLGALMIASTVGTFELSFRLGRRLAAPGWIAGSASLIVTLQTARMSVWGMETLLAIPLYFGFLLALSRSGRWGIRQSSALGLLGSLLVLARLDTIMLVGVGVAAWVAIMEGSWRDRAVRLVAFCSGGVLLPVYLVVNRIIFGSFLPFSAVAKQMTTSFGVNTGIVNDLLGDSLGVAGVVTTVAAICITAWKRERLIARDRPGQLAVVLALGFPFLFFGVYALRSDWSLFQWYLYPWIPALGVSMVLLLRTVPQLEPLRWGLITVCILACLAAAGSPLRRRAFDWRPESMSLYLHARTLEKFARTHPGNYAMGDRAGLTAWFLSRPVLQLEGLVADRALLEHIRRQDPLDQVLLTYGVNYLIVSVYAPLKRADGCYVVHVPDPSQSGVRSARMSGRFCNEPVLQFSSPRSNGSGETFTYVFSISSKPIQIR